MKYLKKFDTNTEYTTFTESDKYVLPNVSWVVDGNNVLYNPAESGLVYNMVDLGLPSGLLWADRNVGAASPEDYGLYFQWGDTVGYTAEQVANGEKAFSSDWSDYFDTTDGGSTFNKYAKGKLITLEASDDAASVNMGSDWRMPTKVEIQELIDNTAPTFIDLQGNEFSQSEALSGAIAEYNLKGVRFTGSNDNSIFIPTSGGCGDSTFTYTGFDCSLWSSDFHSSYSRYAWHLYFYCGGDLDIAGANRCYGYSVRGVCNK